jgi:NAD(P)-dependent dehydrogenase (short-subunit alcohol dehydrogenase family)
MGTNWLRDKVGVVTGASRGIGHATAEALSGAGMRVVAAARTRPSFGDGTLGIECDVSNPDDVDRLFDAAAETGPLSVLVCAAGVLDKALIAETTPELWDRTLAINLTGTFLCARRAFETMKRSGGGRIVTIGSLSGVYATEKFPGLAAYNVSKFGVVGLTEALAVEGRDHGISAICISPGAVDTEMLRAAAPHLNPGLVPADVGRLIVSLLDEDLAPLSGANIPLFSNR